MNKINRFHVVSSLVLLIILFAFQSTFAQIPKPFLNFVKKQNKVKSGYVKLQHIYMEDHDTTGIEMQEAFFISTPKDLKYLTYHNNPYRSNIYCKSAHTDVSFYNLKNFGRTRYYYDDKIYDAKHDADFLNLYYSTAHGMFLERWKNCIFQRIPPKIDKKNIRYKIVYPDDEIDSDKSLEYEFDRKTFHWVQEEFSLTYLKAERIYSRTDILEQRLYEYIHPDILDTISFMFEKLKRGYDRQYAAEQAEKDSMFRDSLVRAVSSHGGIWAEALPQDAQKDTVFFMPAWMFPLLSGDTLYSDSIRSQFLLLDMWYISCHPCRLAMRELSSIDTLYDESLLKMVSINVSDKDTAKIGKVVNSLDLRCDVACAYDGDDIYVMSKTMGSCRGYPQLYLIDMNTKQVIWHSCGWYEGFTKEIGEIITTCGEQ